MEDAKLVIDTSAMTVLGNMQQRVTAIGKQYGEHSPEHVEVLKSFNEALMSVLRLGGKVLSDGELSLVSLSFITYGVVFHPKYTDDGRDPLLGSWSTHS